MINGKIKIKGTLYIRDDIPILGEALRGMVSELKGEPIGMIKTEPKNIGSPGKNDALYNTKISLEKNSDMLVTGTTISAERLKGMDKEATGYPLKRGTDGRMMKRGGVK